jgi:molybdopterin-guanine dinucleotide biosynthesis protein A
MGLAMEDEPHDGQIRRAAVKLGAAILVGGRSRRMGEDKATLDWNGRSAIDRAFDLAATAGAGLVLAVGRELPGRPSVADDGAGPVGGVILAADRLAEAGYARALILAVDAPTLTVADLEPLLRAAPGAAFEGQHLPMVLPFAALPAEAKASWPLGRLAERAGLARPPCPPATLARVRGANTKGERQALLEDLIRREGAGRSGAD